ncbi:MAG: hypothetical protein ABI212_02575 [Burkholderiaceae bacterium]
MALSVRLNPLLEKELELAAQRRGITKSQFVIDAVQRSLGRGNAYELMVELQAEEVRAGQQSESGHFAGIEQPYDADAARNFIKNQLKERDDASRTG